MDFGKALANWRIRDIRSRTTRFKKKKATETEAFRAASGVDHIAYDGKRRIQLQGLGSVKLACTLPSTRLRQSGRMDLSGDSAGWPPLPRCRNRRGEVDETQRDGPAAARSPSTPGRKRTGASHYGLPLSRGKNSLKPKSPEPGKRGGGGVPTLPRPRPVSAGAKAHGARLSHSPPESRPGTRSPPSGSPHPPSAGRPAWKCPPN